MDVRAQITYPTADPETVFALAMDERFRGAVCEATAALSYDVDIARHPDGAATVTIRRTMPAEVPDYVRRFVGETIDLVQTERWPAADAGRPRTAKLELVVRGQPAAMTGDVSIEAAGAGARTVIRGDLKVSIPFVGRAVEPEIAKAVLAAIDKEQQVADRWLGEPS